MIRFDRDFIKDMKENKDIEKNERRLRIIRDALFIVIPLIIIVFIFLTYIKDIKTSFKRKDDTVDIRRFIFSVFLYGTVLYSIFYLP